MRWVLLLVAMAAVAGTGAGYWYGSGVAKYGDFAALLLNIKAERLGSDNKYVLNYVCDDKIIATYDVDKKQLLSAMGVRETIRFLRKGGLDKPASADSAILNYKQGLSFLLGGGVFSFGKPILAAATSMFAAVVPANGSWPL